MSLVPTAINSHNHSPCKCISQQQGLQPLKASITRLDHCAHLTRRWMSIGGLEWSI
jgi:hypothetical protein